MVIAGRHVCDVHGCPRVATGRVGSLRVCNAHWMRWYRKAEQWDKPVYPSDHANALEKDLRNMWRVQRAIAGASKDGVEVEYSELYRECIVSAKDLARLHAREWVTLRCVDGDDGEVFVALTPDGKKELTAFEAAVALVHRHRRLDAQARGEAYVADDPFAL
jgi:hypothetical protein